MNNAKENARMGKQAGAQEALQYRQGNTNTATLQPDKTIADEFLHFLDPLADEFIFRHFPEKGGKGYGGNLVGTLAECWPQLLRHNQAGHAIAVQINHGKPTVNSKGKPTYGAESIDRARPVLFADFDPPDELKGTPEAAALAEQTKAALLADALPPSLIVQSSAGGIHAYWRFAGDLPLDQWEAQQEAIAHAYGSDKAMRNRDRVMRLAGFLHQKGAPYLSHIAHKTDAPPYTLAQLRARFPQQPKERKAQAKPAAQPRDTDGNASGDYFLLQQACHAIAAAKAGAEQGRNNELNRQAFLLFQRIQGGSLRIPTETAMQQLTEAAKQTGLEETEITNTLNSALQKAAQDPIYSHDEITGGRVLYSKRAIWFHPAAKEGGKVPAPIRLATKLEIVANTRDDNGDYGLWLRGEDKKGRAIQCAIPRGMAVNPPELALYLAKKGFQFESSRQQKEWLAQHIFQCPIDREVMTSARLGWHGDNYLLPDKVITADSLVGTDSDTAERVFQSDSALQPAFSSAGTLADWQQHIGKLAAGNPLLMLGLCAGFAAPLLELAGIEAGGFALHLRGNSSAGKTTAARMAASLWGKASRYLHTWRATANGLEGLAEAHSDALLLLDEISQASSKDIGEAAYMLMNGQGKARKDKEGKPRPVKWWRLILLSTGEKGLIDILAELNKSPNAGQEIRFLDIEAGNIFSCLHGFTTEGDLANHLNHAVNQYYGAAGEEYLRRLVKDRPRLRAEIKDRINKIAKALAPEGASAQVLRVARSFALLIVAGELASQYGITGWQQGEVMPAIQACFNTWLEGFGTGNKEEQSALADIKAFFVMHGNSRFGCWNTKDARQILSQVGYWRYTEQGDLHYLVHPEMLKHVFKGHDQKTAVRAALAAGYLVANSQGKAVHPQRIGGQHESFYLFSSHGMGIPVPEKDHWTLDQSATAQANAAVSAQPIKTTYITKAYANRGG